MEQVIAKGKTEAFDKLKAQLGRNTSWRKYRISPELASLGMGVIRLLPSEVVLGLSDTAPEPRGKAKQFWVMRLRRLPGRNQLPRGFSKKPLFV